MATSMRGSLGSGKEKRGTSPSTTTIKKSPKPLSPSSPSDEKTSSSSDSSKPVPNYLKPTISSAPDHNKIPKKTSTDTSASNPTHARRRSIDRPPPASQVQRAAWGSPVGARDFKHQRSSSFSNKSTVSSSSSARPASERLYARTSSLKEGKVDPNLSRSHSLKKSTLSESTKKEPTSGYRKKGPKSVTSESSVDYENRPSVDHLSLEDDWENVDAHEVPSHPELSGMPDTNEALGFPTNVDPKESTLEEKQMVVDQVLEETKQADPHPVVKQSSNVEDAGKQVDEDEGNQQDEGTTYHQEQIEIKVPEGKPIDARVEEKKVPEIEPIDARVEEKKMPEVNPIDAPVEEEKMEVTPIDAPVEEEKMPKVKPIDATVEEEKIPEVKPIDTMVEEKEEVKEQIKTEAKKQDVEPAEAKDESQTVSIPAAKSDTPTKTSQPSSAGKKDKQVYNDVIEKTTTKLMGTGEKRNKVLALAGAFETVISLQDTNKS